MHYYLPGWEIPKVKAEYLTNEFGFISDYFAEFAREMRKEDHSHDFDKWFKFNSDVNTRDRNKKNRQRFLEDSLPGWSV